MRELQVLTGSLNQWTVKFRFSFGQPNWCMNVLGTEARDARVAGSNQPFALFLILFRSSSEFSI